MLLRNLAKRQNTRLVIIFLNCSNPCASIPPKLSGRYENPRDSKLKRGTSVFGFGGWELLLILIIVLIVFGAGKLPQLGEGLGKALKGFKKTVHEPEPQEITEAQPGVGSGGASAGSPPGMIAPTSQASSASGTPAGAPARHEAGKT